MGDATSNAKTRKRLHEKQGGRCFYCPQIIGVHVGENMNPVLEHYIPRSAGGYKVVLACNPCDKMKGMIHGPAFQEIILTMTLPGDAPNSIRQKIAAHCKAINCTLQEKHPAREVGAEKTKERTKARAAMVGVVITQFPVGPSCAHQGCSGRDAFIAEWEKSRQQTST